jgi:PIN domain nuclease of toxin-antitoxin system
VDTVHLDTHTAVWLYAGRKDLFSPRALKVLDSAELYISPMVLLEIQFLKEAKKVDIKVDTFLRDMRAELGLKLCETDFSSVTLEAVRIAWTRDPFDRMIVAQAMAEDAPLITRDKIITEHYRKAFWL